VAYAQGAPCSPLTLHLDGPCLTSDPATFDLNLLPLLAPLLGVNLNPAWQARLHIQSLWLEGRMAEDAGAAHVADGLMHITGSGTQAVADLKGILVSEYCAGNIAGCVPGAASMPACPADAGRPSLTAYPRPAT